MNIISVGYIYLCFFDVLPVDTRFVEDDIRTLFKTYRRNALFQTVFRCLDGKLLEGDSGLATGMMYYSDALSRWWMLMCSDRRQNVDLPQWH